MSIHLDVIDIGRSDRTKLQAEVLALRQQGHVLERQITRVRCSQVAG